MTFRSPAGGITGGGVGVCADRGKSTRAGGITGGVDGDGSQRVNFCSAGISLEFHGWNFYRVKKTSAGIQYPFFSGYALYSFYFLHTSVVVMELAAWNKKVVLYCT